MVLGLISHRLPWWLRQQRICLQCKRPGFDPWVRKIPQRRKWQSTPVFLPGESRGQRSLVGYSPWGCKDLDITEWPTVSLSFRINNYTMDEHMKYNLLLKGRLVQKRPFEWGDWFGKVTQRKTVPLFFVQGEQGLGSRYSMVLEGSKRISVCLGAVKVTWQQEEEAKKSWIIKCRVCHIKFLKYAGFSLISILIPH